MKNKKQTKNKTDRKNPRSIMESLPSRKWRGNILTIPLFLIAMATPIMAHAGEDTYGHHSMMGGYWGSINGMWVLGWIFMLLIIVALVVFIIWMVKKIQEDK